MNSFKTITLTNGIRPEFFGVDQKILKALEFAKNLSITKSPVLISGEVGIGKKTLAYYIHQNSIRKDHPLIVVNCSEDTLEVEKMILGHRNEENGRFQRGALESGNGGTVILENIDVLSDEFQKKIFGIICELPDYDLDVRIMATTTKNLSKLVGNGRFNRSLFIFISSNQIHLTPLRERRDDIRYLSNQYLAGHASSLQRSQYSISEDVMDKMLTYYWTHNITELKHVVETSFDQANDGNIGPMELTLGERKIHPTTFDMDEDGMKLMSLKEAERLLIKKALIHTSENRTQAAKILGVSIRTLRNKINEYRNEGSSYFINLR